MDNKMKDGIITFLKNMAEDVESGNVSDVQMCTISEFYMKYLFTDAVKNSNHSENQSGELPDTKNMSHDDLMRFLTLGWYIYTIKDD